MPTRHKYLLVISLDQNQIEEIKKMFVTKYIVRPSNIDEVLGLINQNKDNIAGVLVDDSVEEKKILQFFKACKEEKILETLPVFLTYTHRNSEVYNQAIHIGIDELIKKPYVNELIEKRINHIIDVISHKFRLEWIIDTQTKELKESIQVLEDLKIQVLEALGTLVEFRNLESGEHLYRVRFVTDILMRRLKEKYPQYGITDEIIDVTNLASILHDIGKIMISDVILNKPAKLTQEEFYEMQLHTYYGAQILDKLNGLYTDKTHHFFKDVILYHHEKYDGKGYPEGLKGEDIPIWAQVVSLADVYDALTNERVYKKAYSHNQAVKMIFDGECGVFNPIILDCFEEVQNQIIKKTEEVKQQGLDHIPSFTDKEHNTIINDYEKEKAIHRAYQELVNDYFFEYDIEYGTVQYFNALGKKNEERYRLSDFEGMNKKQEKLLEKAIQDATPDNPTIKMEVELTQQGRTRLYLLTIRTTWDMYTKKCLGSVGKIEKL